VLKERGLSILSKSKALPYIATLIFFFVLSNSKNTTYFIEIKRKTCVDSSCVRGRILRHNKDVSHLIKGSLSGFIHSYNTNTYGLERWKQAYNYPDYGVSLIYHNTDNEVLGTLLGLHGYCGFHFLKGSLFFRVGTGISYASNPFDLDGDFKNNAYGTQLLNSTYFRLNYTKLNFFNSLF
jgi:hypothetical protein